MLRPAVRGLCANFTLFARVLSGDDNVQPRDFLGYHRIRFRRYDLLFHMVSVLSVLLVRSERDRLDGTNLVRIQPNTGLGMREDRIDSVTVGMCIQLRSVLVFCLDVLVTLLNDDCDLQIPYDTQS
jgi:hypothetical protein